MMAPTFFPNLPVFAPVLKPLVPAPLTLSQSQPIATGAVLAETPAPIAVSGPATDSRNRTAGPPTDPATVMATDLT